MNDALKLSGLQQGALIRSGAITSEELVRAHLDRIACVNPKINAAIEVLADSALEAARRSDQRSERLSPFDGVPFSVKDSIEVQGTSCSAGTLGYRDAPKSPRDATLVSRLRNAGAIPIARTNLPDLLFAFESDNLIYGRTNNPYDLSRTPGGSSGGESALIASCGSPFGLGSDCAGSVRVPAHYCGIASIKPTSGRLPRTGHVPPAGGWIEMLWQIGPMARRVEDLSMLTQILAHPDGEDRTVPPVPVFNPVEKLRIAFFVSDEFARPDDDTRAVVDRAASALGAQPCNPPCIDRSWELEMKLLGADGGEGVRAFLNQIGSTTTHPLLDAWLSKLEPFRTSASGFAQYWSELDEFRASMDSLLDSFDAIISPVSAHPALPHGTSVEDRNFRGFSYTMTHNLTGWPAAVVRCGETRDKLPIGVQIAAAPWREDIALAVALQLEEAFGGWQPPPVTP
jgi:amidase